MLDGIARREFIGRAAAGSAIVLLSSPAAAAAAAPAIAGIVGPVPVTAASGQPYRGANEQPVAGPGLSIPSLQPYDYVEEEYFVTGEVGGQPYRTTMLVRKPRDRRKFSGLVAVETIHAAGAVPLWGQKRAWLTGGHGWVGIGSQLVALEQHIKRSNPARYASLQIPAAPTQPSASPGAGMAGGPQDMISQAIMAQVGRLLKANRRGGPFRGMMVRKLIMGGSSQTGGTTLRYIQQSHANERLANGNAIYDGYLPSMAFPSVPLPSTDAIVVHTVTEGDLMNALASRRPLGFKPDGDGPDCYRHYQITGMSHVGTRGVTDPVQVFSTLANGLNPGERLSQFPAAEMMNPLTQHFVNWVMLGVVPPKAPMIEMTNGQIIRDEIGNAKGGIRSPYVNVPTVRYIATAPTGPTDNPSRRLIGLEQPIPADKLRALYGNRERYLQQFNQEIDRTVAGGWLLPDEALKLKADEAKRSLF